MSDRTSATPRLIQLDVLRGIAILLVLGAHSVLLSGDAGRLRFSVMAWTRIGWSGVDLFFVLSGFLVGGLLFKEYRERGRLDIGRFLVRRGFKIWPSYYVYLAVASLIYFPLAGRGLPKLSELLPSLFHLQNYLGTPYGHTWSLGVEEHFYIFLPLLLLFMDRIGRDGSGWAAVPYLLAGLIVGVASYRCWALTGVPYDSRTHQFPTHLRVDGLLFGVLLAYLTQFKPGFTQWVRGHRMHLLIAALLIMAPMLKFPLGDKLFVPTLGFTMMYLGYGALLLVVVNTPRGDGALGRFFNTRAAAALAFVGTYSYSIYLWHIEFCLFPMRWIARAGFFTAMPPELRWWALQIVYVLAAVAVGVITGKLIEMPALAARERLFPARATTAVKAPLVQEISAVPAGSGA